MRYKTRAISLTAPVIGKSRTDALFGVKTCTSCATEKSLSEFFKSNAGIGGFASRCKACARDYVRQRAQNSDNVLFRVNKAILKRQTHGTDVCSLADAPAYRATAHLLDEHGLLSVGDGHTFRTVFAANKPEKLQKIVERTSVLAANREIRLAETKARQDARAAAKRAEKLATAGQPRVMELTASNIETLLYERVRRHLKKCRRKGYTVFSFTRANFTTITGYTPRELRKHLHQFMPEGATWADVVSGAVHVEHATPSAAFDLTSIASVKQCYSLSNLTLLWADENHKKGATTDKTTVAHFRNDRELASLFGLAE